MVNDLATRYRGTLGRETVQQYVHDSYRLLSAREHTPLLASRTAAFASARLDDLGRDAGNAETVVPTVLFVCVQNAGRSQLAAAYLRHLAGDAVHVRTAGSTPATEVHPRIAEALAEAGIPPTDDYPKPLTDEVVQAADYVVTMGCGDACPVYPGRRYLDWELDDPLTLDDAGMRRVRDEVRERVGGLLVELGFGDQQASR